MSIGVSALLEHHRVGDFCFGYEEVICIGLRSKKEIPVLYLMVPGEGLDSELVKLYMHRTTTRWDEPGTVVAWNWNRKAPSLLGAIQTSHWTGYLVRGRLRGTDA